MLALPIYIVAAIRSGLSITDLGILLGAQTVGSLASNSVWGRLGDAHGKLTLLRNVRWLRMIPPRFAIGFLGYLLEKSPNDRRPAYSGYFNALASQAALLPLARAMIADLVSLTAVFAVAIAAAAVQQVLYARLAGWENY